LRHAVFASTLHSTVQTLKESNFDDALADPANGLWLIKFYAPWCGHCKKLAPILEQVAAFIKGKMAIGKVDCTQEKDLCKKYEVKSFPTMKFFRDGEFYDFPGERTADSMIEFAELMSLSAVSSITSHAVAYDEIAASNRDGVAFIAYDPEAKGDDTEQILQSTTLLQVFQQVARKRQAYASFAVIAPDTPQEEIDVFGIETKPFVIKVEKDVTPTLYTDLIDTSSLLQFVKTENLPLVTFLGAHNFHSVGNLGKSLVILAIDPDQTERQLAPHLKQLKDYAKSGQHKGKYIFCQIDGKKWERFLNQFEVNKKTLPELFVLDVPKRVFWQDSSILSAEEFLEAVNNGQIPGRNQVGKSGTGMLSEFKSMFMVYMPYSAILAVVMFFMFYYIFSLHDDDVEVVDKRKKKKSEKSDEKGSKKKD